jgi:predicted TIM-barrel fold metal-dependent hydrolase
LGVNEGAAHVKARGSDEVRAMFARGDFQVLGEVMAQYEGIPADDPRLEPYWALAEKFDIPVGIHMGPGGPGDPYFGSPGYRARYSSPLRLEDVLVRHPKLRVYIMHAGYPFLDDLRALLFSHPQVYVDIASIVYTEPRAAFYGYLKGIVEAGYGDRVMFGSDQMIWPGVIEPSIQAIEDAPFLTQAQKRDILYNNAARFLRLSKEEIARHHAM